MIFKYKTGLCGEWSSAFTCMCLALGYKARLCQSVEDDHVWTEVYLEEFDKMRWIHIDAFE